MIAINPVDRLPCLHKFPMSHKYIPYNHIPGKFEIAKNFTPHKYFEGIEWMFNTATVFRLTNTVLFDAIDLMNRYYKLNPIYRNTYSQINIASMIISIKINDSDVKYINKLMECFDCENGSILTSEVGIVNSLLPNIIPCHAYVYKDRNEIFNIYRTICNTRNHYPQQLSYDEIISM
jgi:hypothetical protein